jgi:hypothetical protein
MYNILSTGSVSVFVMPCFDVTTLYPLLKPAGPSWYCWKAHDEEGVHVRPFNKFWSNKAQVIEFFYKIFIFENDFLTKKGEL